MLRKSIYSDEYFDPNEALWPEKWRGTEEGLIIVLDVYNLKPETIKSESSYVEGVENDRVIVFKIKNSDIIRIIRLSNMLYFEKKSNTKIFIKKEDGPYIFRDDLIARVSNNSMVFLN